jgi:hypothetical protein
LTRLHSFDGYDLSGRGYNEKRAVGVTSPVDVDSVIRLLLPDVFEGFVLAARHRMGPDEDGIYVLVGPGGLLRSG